MKANQKLRVAIVVHGRFHAFDLARELLATSHDVTVVTNYPKRIASRFGLRKEQFRTVPLHGIVSRLIHRVPSTAVRRWCEPFLHRWFSRAAARRVPWNDIDILHVFSGVAEEVIRKKPTDKITASVSRGSSHIEEQSSLLLAEEKRLGRPIDRPSDWMMGRENREYELADAVIVLSSFAEKSFEARGLPPDRVKVLPLGSELGRFRPEESVIESRVKRILAGEPLRVLTVGTFSGRKGAVDLAHIARRLAKQMTFRFVGDDTAECAHLADVNSIEFVARRPQNSLAIEYEWADLFLFPTIEDGYAVVLAQAQANGLPVLATTNSAAPDILEEGRTGWVLPIRSPDAFIDRLRWCDQNRQAVADMVHRIYANRVTRDWSAVADDFVRIHRELHNRRKASHLDQGLSGSSTMACHGNLATTTNGS